MDHNLLPIALDESFQFACSPEVPCFNECCRDLNQFLTPYDILRLKSHLKLTSGEFLQRYTSRHIGPESGLPIVALKPSDPYRLTCPFVTAKGCAVYESRPSSCRIYPLVRAILRSRVTGRINEQFMILKEPHCLGFNQGRRRTVGDWVREQGIADYNENNDSLLEIIRLKNKLHPGPLDIKTEHTFYTTLYDLDGFRHHLRTMGLSKGFTVDGKLMNRAAGVDDVALLELGIKWIKHLLFKPRFSGSGFSVPGWKYD